MKDRLSAFASSRTPLSQLIIEEMEERATVEALEVVGMQNAHAMHAVEGIACKEELNDSQRQACLDCLTHRVCLIQGPPGTGKTTCIKALAQLYVRCGGLLGCAAPSNLATDNVCRGIEGTRGGFSFLVHLFCCLFLLLEFPALFFLF